ncbi:CBS domain-containing protein [Isoptericola halotolerans]|uniref:CBS domain containing-hemolysin-like protein n=1 Tax=Isoptericola halotolerans TaxID=300560 RepID=A0ABX2A821_9MICO|nr:CBS domain containing-hemolysin-like protein [Isoptericola halotolerans]
MDAPDPVLWLVLLVCLALSAVLSAGQTAVQRVTRASLAEALAEALSEADADGAVPGPARTARSRRVQRAQHLAVDPAVPVSLALVRVLAESVSVGALAVLLLDWFEVWWEALLGVALAGLVAGVLLMRLSPRTWAHRHPARALILLATPLWVAHRSVGWVPRRRLPGEAAVPEGEELRDMADRVRENEAIEAPERELLRSALELGGTLAREVMVPRPDMVTVGSRTTLHKAMRLFLRSGFSRVPVVGRTVDDLVGVVYLKDVARLLDADPSAGDRPVVDHVRAPVFVPESKPADDLLRDMQARRSHIAIVVDEYGGVAGLVTVEDIIEELVGELTDEHDTGSEPVPEDLGDGTWRVPARWPVDELGELFGLRLDDDDVDTAGGLLAKHLGKVPLTGARADVGPLRLEAERVEGRRKQLASILVRRSAHPAADDVVVPHDQKDVSA